MIQTVILAGLEILGESYTVIRRALVIYDRVVDITNVVEYLTKSSPLEQIEAESETLHAKDNIFFFVLGFGIYDKILTSSPGYTNQKQNDILLSVTDIILSEAMTNAPTDPLTKVSTFIDLIAYDLALNHPEMYSRIAELVQDNVSTDHILTYVTDIYTRPVSEKLLNEYLVNLGYTREDCALIKTLFVDKVINVVLTSIWPSIATGEYQFDQALSVMKLLLAAYTQRSDLLGDITVTSQSGSFVLNTLSLPNPEYSDPITLKKKIRYQKYSMTNLFVNGIAKILARRAGYRPDDRDPSSSDLSTTIVSQEAQEMIEQMESGLTPEQLVRRRDVVKAAKSFRDVIARKYRIKMHQKTKQQKVNRKADPSYSSETAKTENKRRAIKVKSNKRT